MGIHTEMVFIIPLNFDHEILELANDNTLPLGKIDLTRSGNLEFLSWL